MAAAPIGPLLVLVASLHWAAASVYHTHAVDAFVTSTNVSSVSLASEVNIAERALADPTMTAFVNLFTSLDTGTWQTSPLALMTVCVGHSLPSIDVITTVAKLGTALAGTPTSDVFVALDGARYAAHDVVFVLPRATAAMTVILRALARQNVAGITANDGYPASIRANPRVVWVATDADVAAAVQSAPNRIGFAAATQCGKLAKAGVAVTIRGRTTVVHSDIDADAARLYTMEDLEAIPSSNEASYPFVGGVLLHVKTPMACDERRHEYELFLDMLKSTAVRPLLFSQSETVALGDEQILRVLDEAGYECTTAHHTSSRGSAALEPAMHRWAFDYMALAGAVVEYIGSGSGSGIRAITQYDVPFAATDSLFDAEERRTFPSIRFAAAVAFALSVFVNVPGASGVTIPECTLLGMLQGTVTHWDDPTLLAANPALALPHEPIVVVARTTRSGATEVFTAGLANIDSMCNTVPTLNATNTWALKTDLGTTSSSQVLDMVADTAWSIGYAPATSARDRGATEAVVLQVGGNRVSTDAGFILAAAAAALAVFDGTTFRFVYAPNAYPFVGVSYFMYHASYPGNCTLVKEGIDFVKWVIGDSTAHAVAVDLRYVPVTGPIADATIADLNTVQCAGQYLYPQPVGSDVFPIWAVVVLVKVMVLTVVGALTVIARRRGAGVRDVRNAPRQSPVTIVFTAVDEASKLWTNCPASMSLAMADHHRVVRAAIAKFGAYEVKTIGESFMIAAHTAQEAVRLAIEVQQNLHSTMCPTAINEAYELDGAFVTVDDDPEDLAAIEPTWNGLRVKIGIHMGCPEVRFDEVTKGYDYYGNDVNIAARVASSAHGGQILCTRTVAEEVNATHTCQDVGAAELKGVAGKTPLTSIAIPSLKGRIFAQLCAEDMEIGGETAATTSFSHDTETSHTDHIQSFPFVRDGSMSYQAAEGEVYAMADSLEYLFMAPSAQDRTGGLKMLRHAWHLPSTADTNDDYVRLAVKVYPLIVASMRGRRLSRHSTYHQCLRRAESNQSSMGLARQASNVSDGVSEQ